jgi:glycogen operon protein
MTRYLHSSPSPLSLESREREDPIPAGARVVQCGDEAVNRWEAVEGSPLPEGISWVEAEQAYNFALYSEHAESVTLLLYRADDLVEPVLARRLDHLRHKSGRIWHCRIPEVEMKDAGYYAYAIDGAPETTGNFRRHRFDSEKILLDPYARSVFFPQSFDRNAAIGPGSNAGKAPLGAIRACRCSFDWGGDHRPRHDWDTVIYELHVKGFTNNPNSGVSPEHRGTYLGLIEKLPHLEELGVTAVELMPVFQYDPQEGNYWGYNPLNFFSPHDGYASRRLACEQDDEMRSMVKALHEAGIEVILDVVYNHTGEGNQSGPVYSFKGIDNDVYYMLTGRPGEPYANFSGTGNTLNCGHRYVRKMILDSLRYWVQEMHVDGFRFDLASVFVRKPDGSLDLEDPRLFGDIIADPRLARTRLIAEPWDAAGAYQLGRTLPGITWFQWNDRFRVDVRRFVRGEPGILPALMYRLYGSDDLFPDDRMSAYHAYQSVNYVDCHDGFTLYDLVSYNEKRNWANGHGNADGPRENYSWNCGWEGEENAPPEVARLRKRQVKNFCCLLFLSNGTPMFRAGDEFLQTQEGNNNPYNQDNPTSWLDWSRLRDNRDIFRFFRCMIRFRKDHPSIGRSRFWRDDVRWYGVGPSVDLSPESRSLAFRLLPGDSGSDAEIYVMINARGEDVTFDIQETNGRPWRRVIDTSLESPEDFREPGTEVLLPGPSYRVSARSTVVLVRPHEA